MPSQLLPSGIKLGDGLGDFIRFTTDAPYQTVKTRGRPNDRDRETEATGSANDARTRVQDGSH